MKKLMFSLAGALVALGPVYAADSSRLKDSSLLDFIKENRGKSEESLNGVLDELIDLRAQPQVSSTALDEEIKKLNSQKRLVEHLSKQLNGHYGYLGDRQADAFAEIWKDPAKLDALKKATAAAKYEGARIVLSEGSPYQFSPKAFMEGNQLKFVYNFSVDEGSLNKLPYYTEILSHYGSTANIKAELEKLMNTELSKKEVSVTITDEMKTNPKHLQDQLRRNFAPLHEGLLKSDRGVGAVVAQELTKLDNEVSKKENRKSGTGGAAASRDLTKVSQLERIAKFLKSSSSAGQDACKTIYDLKLWDSLSDEEREIECSELNDKLKAKNANPRAGGHGRSATGALNEATGAAAPSEAEKPLTPLQQFNAQMQYMQALTQARAQENMAQCFSMTQTQAALEPLRAVVKAIEPTTNSLLGMRTALLAQVMAAEKPGFSVDYTIAADDVLNQTENTLEANLKLKTEKERLLQLIPKTQEAMTKARIDMTGVLGTNAEPGTPDFESAKGYFRARLEQRGATPLQVEEAFKTIAKFEASFIEAKKTGDAAMILLRGIDRTLDLRKTTARGTNFREVNRANNARPAGIPTVGGVPGQLNTPAPMVVPTPTSAPAQQGPNFLGTGR